jgi:hypothetical protein
MKKFIVFFFVLTMSGGFVTAQEGQGISPGLHFEFDDIAGDGGIGLWIVPNVEYENSFFDDTLDLWAYFGVWLGSSNELRILNNNSTEVMPVGFIFELEPWCNLELNPASTLSFGFWLGFGYWLPKVDDVSAIDFELTPMINFNHNISSLGDLYAKIELPLILAEQGWEDTDDFKTNIGLNIALGWESEFGLGIEAIPMLKFAPSDFYEDKFYGIGSKIWYTFDPLYFEVEAFFPAGDYLDWEGAWIRPEVQFKLFETFTVYAGAEFSNINAKDVLDVNDGKVRISPFFGFRYRF